MSSALEQMPVDLLLEISLSLDITDSVALLSTCQCLRKCMSEKSFWVRALEERRKEGHPVAVPIWQDLLTMSLLELQEAGKRTARIAKNWAAESPRFESIRETYVDSMSNIIVIPGTGLVIAHGPTHAACWDIYKEDCVARLVLEPETIIESANFQEYGKVILGGFVANAARFQVVAICVDFRNRGTVSMFQILTHTFPHLRREFFKASKISVDHDTVRVVVTTSDPSEYILLSVSLGGEEHVVQNIMTMVARTQSPLRSRVVSSRPTSTGTYFFRHMATCGEVAYLQLPSGQSGTHIIRSTVPIHPDFSFEIRHHIPADPAAAAVALLTASPSKVEFWPVSRCRTDDGLVFDATSAHLMQDRVINSVIVGASGVYALLATSGSVATGAPLGLLRYVAGAGSAPVYRPLALAVPWLTMYTNEGQMVLDDHLGLILSVRGDGKLRIISYG